MECRFRKKGSLGKGGLFGKVYFLEILEKLEILEFLEDPQTAENKGESEPFSRDTREFRDFRDSRDSCSEKTSFVMTPFFGPGSDNLGLFLFQASLPITLFANNTVRWACFKASAEEIFVNRGVSKTRTTIWKPPFTDLRGLKSSREEALIAKILHTPYLI